MTRSVGDSHYDEDRTMETNGTLTQGYRRQSRTRIDDNDVEFSKSKRVKNISTTEEERTKLISDIVRFFLFSDINKTVVKREGITKIVLEKYRGIKLLNELIQEASKVLEDVFGFELVKCAQYDAVKRKVEITTQNAWIIRRKKDLHQYIEPIQDQIKFNNSERYGVLMVILGYILTQNFMVDEEDLWNVLSKFGIDKDSQHVLFGDTKALIKEFVKKNYLVYKKIKNKGFKTAEVYLIGPRAIIEIGVSNIFRFVAKICGVENPDSKIIAEFRDEDDKDENGDNNNNNNDNDTQK